MSKILIFFISFISYLHLYSQVKIKILDEESKQPITNIKILNSNSMLYSNEDGIIILPADNSLSTLTIESPFYEKKVIDNINIDTTVLLKPIYKQIEEVTIEKLDFNKFVKKLYENYNQYYDTYPYLYDAKYKDKLLINNKVNSLLIADINLYSVMNAVGMTLTGNVDKSNQISLNKVNYYKVSNSDINFKEFTNKRAISWFNVRMFLNGEFAILQFGLKDFPVKTQTIYQDEHYKKVSFITETTARRGATFNGNFIVDKENGAITYMEVEQTYDKSERTYKSDNGKMMIDTKSVIAVYDLYKKDNKYLPAKFTLIQKGVITNKEKEENFSRTREIIFTNGKKTSNNITLQNKMDISNKDILFYIPDDIKKDAKTLLSAEEQKFVDE